MAYEKLTGELRRKTPSLGLVGYVSPAVVKIDGKDHLVMITPSTNPFRRSTDVGFEYGNVVGIHPRSGQILWKYSKWNCHVSAPSAVDAGGNKLLGVSEIGEKAYATPAVVGDRVYIRGQQLDDQLASWVQEAYDVGCQRHLR